MGTWKNPNRLVWHEVSCSRCNKVITRIKLPGLTRSRSERLCNECAAAGPQPPRTGREPRGRAPRRAPPARAASS